MNTSTHRTGRSCTLLANGVCVLICGALFAACHRESSSPSAPIAQSPGPDCIARVGDVTITRAAFEKEWARRGYRTSKEAVLEEMVHTAALLVRAKEAGYDRDPEIVARINDFIITRFQENELAKGVATPAAVTASEIERFYQNGTEQFREPATARAGVIFVKCSPRATDEKKAERRRRAEEVLAEARRVDAAGFRRLAERHSDDQATRYVGGDTGWLRANVDAAPWPESVKEAVFALSQSGDCASLVTAEQGFYIVRLTDRAPARVRPLDEVREAIVYQLAQEKRRVAEAEFLERMKSGLDIELNAPLLEALPAPAHASEPQPPALPGS